MEFVQCAPDNNLIYLKVLIVEDDENDYFMTHNSLVMYEPEGYCIDCQHCTRGEDAWILIKKSHFDLIILDNVLPQMSGLELLKLMKDHLTSPPKVIMYTAMWSFAAEHVAKKLGAAFVQKSSDAEFLKQFPRLVIDYIERL